MRETRPACDGSGEAPIDPTDRPVHAHGRNVCPVCNGVQFLTAAGGMRKHPANNDPRVDADALR